MAACGLSRGTAAGDSLEYLRLPRGFVELDAALAGRVKLLEHDWFAQTALCGLRPLWIPPVGFASTFDRGHGAATGRNYTFSDRKGRRLALVSDSLPAVLRSLAARPSLESRSSFCSPVFRYVSGVRRRYFHQLGCSELSEPRGGSAEMPGGVVRALHLLLTFFARHGLTNVDVDVYDVAIWYDLLSATHSRSQVRTLLYELKALPLSSWRGQLMAAGAEPLALRWTELLHESDDVRRDSLGLPQLADRLASYFSRIDALLELGAKVGGVRARFAPSLLRSLEFQDGLAFQITLAGTEKRIADGGSYGEFASQFVGQEVRCVSAAAGLEMLAEVEPDARQPEGVFVRVSCPAGARLASTLVTALRARGLRVWESTGSARIARDLGTAEREGLAWFVNLGEREAALDVVSVRARGAEPVAMRLTELLDKFPRARTDASRCGEEE